MLKKLLFTFLCAVLTMCSIKAIGQEVIGKVLDEKGEPMIGVSVKVKGKPLATSTNQNGTFAINGSNNDVLLFSYLGYLNQELTIGNRTNLSISLKPDENALNEVVVVGYGTQKRANLTGSVASIDFSKLENTPQASTVNILAGRLPGLAVVQGGGQPGRDAGDLTIRGIGSLEGSSSPLIVIDGVQSTIQDLSNLAPQEIESVTILKDAASAAIYGSRGGNGVLLVTTKMPTGEKVSINLNAYTAVQEATYLPEFVEPWQWEILKARSTNGVPNQGLVDSLKAGLYSDNLADTKWFDEIFRAAPMHNMNLSASGKTKNTAFQMSAGYLTQQGIMSGTNSKRYNLRGNIKTDLNKIITAGLNIWGYKGFVHEPFQGVNQLIRDASRNPILPVRYANGDFAVFSNYINNTQGIANPLLRTMIGKNDDDEYKINILPSIGIKLSKNLRFNTSLAHSIRSVNTVAFNPTYSYNSQYGLPAYFNPLSVLDNVSRTVTQTQFQSTLNYNRKLGESHVIGALLGHEYVDNYTKMFKAHGEQLPSNQVAVLDNAIANLNVTGNENGYKLQSFFGRANYAYLDKYLLEGNLRYDGSSVVAGKYRASPSASVGWIISKEDFFKVPVIDFFKVRVGYGALGNDQGIGNYTFLQTLSLNNFYNIGGALQTGSALTAFANPEINWERTISKNLGFDIGLLKNKVTLNVDIYDRLTDGILYRVPLPMSFGSATAPVLNLAEVSNKGAEFNLEHNNTIGAFRYSITGNLSYNNNTVEYLAGQRVITNAANNNGGSTILQEGNSVQSWFGFVVDGLYTQADEDAKYPKFNETNVKVGSLKFVDINNDGKIDDLDRTVIGDGNTPYTYGLSLNASYKGFDFSILGQGIAGRDIYIYDFGNKPGNDGTTTFWKEWWTRSYDPVENPTGDWPSMKRQSPEANASSSFWVSNATFLRIKNVEVGYTIPKKVVNRIKIANLRLYASGQNLASFSSVPKNLDPERSNFQKDNGGYPQTRVFSFGLNANF
jgi:TonB-linked SusC/RagA family outer membrane protein